ncbi:EAL domain-containing protein [Noviherbaspirillum cavernae]|uniref:EAL domain-containing protein n=1 Tax=Noviherbaspirillum cavernae TaxID=2320862 RepID=A0A418X1J2_9BURK|nr:EAL domain-containing protein [Noviherbaspirillum cavernae]RJG06301.1 EAL domain-containing protein [Noviherbaspirillum cavernae]
MAPSALDDVLRTQRARDFFLARQPILDRDQGIVAYELLFRSAAAGPANVTDNLAATASVIAHAAELGMENVIGASPGFLNVDAAVLMNDIVPFLPKEKVVLEILETVQVTDDLVARVAELAQAGYVFALDDVVANSENVQKLLSLVDIIKVDISGMKHGDLGALCAHFKTQNKKLLAEKVENVAQFQTCLDLGFDYFQGYYFAKPLVLTGRKLSPSQLTIMHLMGLLLSDAATADIERTIKRDASLGLSLLRLVNSAGIGLTQRIDTIGQALIVLGRRQLQRWLQILLYAEPGKRCNAAASPLLHLATTRGKLLELMAERIKPGNRNTVDIAFTIGIMSLMDALLGQSMNELLEQISVADEVREALLSRSGIYGDMLKLAECTEHVERSNCSQVAELLEKLHLSSDEFNALELTAFQWSESVSRSTG